MKEFLEPRLEVLRFNAGAILLDLSNMPGGDESGSGGGHDMGDEPF